MLFSPSWSFDSPLTLHVWLLCFTPLPPCCISYLLSLYSVWHVVLLYALFCQSGFFNTSKGHNLWTLKSSYYMVNQNSKQYTKTKSWQFVLKMPWSKHRPSLPQRHITAIIIPHSSFYNRCFTTTNDLMTPDRSEH